MDGNVAEMDEEWAYDAKGEWQTMVWQDRLYLASREGVWLKDDIAHRGEWEFTYHGRISELLRNISGQ